MGLRPSSYHEITEFMLCNVRFKSFRTVVDAALRIVSAYRILHNAGYSYQDLNDGNFFVDPDTGKVLICDNDNVAPDGYVTGIAGKTRIYGTRNRCRRCFSEQPDRSFLDGGYLFILLQIRIRSGQALYETGFDPLKMNASCSAVIRCSSWILTMTIMVPTR